MDDRNVPPNSFMVGSTERTHIVIVTLGVALTYEDALNMAAYIVAIADESEGHATFTSKLAAVENA